LVFKIELNFKAIVLGYVTSFAGHGNDRQGLDLKCGKNKLLASLNRKTTKDSLSGRRADSSKMTIMPSNW